MEGDREVTVVAIVAQLQILPIESHFEGLVAEVKVRVNLCDFLGECPSVEVDLNQDVREKNYGLFYMYTEIHFFEESGLVSSELDLHIIVTVQSLVTYALESIANELLIDFGALYQPLYIAQVTYLAGPINPIGLLVEPFGVVELETIQCGLRVLSQKQKGYNCCTCPPLPVVAMHRHHSLLHIFFPHPFEVFVHFVCNFDESGEWGGLMISPLIILHPIIKQGIVVHSAANIYDQVAILMLLIEVIHHIFNLIAICLFDKMRCRVGHGDNSRSNICEIELRPLEVGCIFGASHYLAYQTKHQQQKSLRWYNQQQVHCDVLVKINISTLPSWPTPCRYYSTSMSGPCSLRSRSTSTCSLSPYQPS